LKRVCRANSMSRWPFRKRKSLGKLIDRTKQVLEDGTGQNHMQKLAALQVLSEAGHARVTFLHSLLCGAELDVHSLHATSILCIDHSCALFCSVWWCVVIGALTHPAYQHNSNSSFQTTQTIVQTALCSLIPPSNRPCWLNLFCRAALNSRNCNLP